MHKAERWGDGGEGRRAGRRDHLDGDVSFVNLGEAEVAVLLDEGRGRLEAVLVELGEGGGGRGGGGSEE